MEVGYVMGLKNDVVWILPKLVDYGKSHKCPKGVVWISNASEFMKGFWVIMGRKVLKNV